MIRPSASDSTSSSTSSSPVLNEDQTPTQKESKGTNNVQSHVTQPPYTAHSFILPVSVSSSNAGTRNCLGSTIPPAPLSAPSAHHHMHGPPLAIAPFHGIHHPIMVAAGSNQGQKQASLPTLVVSAPQAAAPGTSIIIPRHLTTKKVTREKESLRSGKWVPEEEEYALLLVRLFKQGLLSDCRNGVTLRAYLARRLNCAPMRISKKFSGSGIGKMVYTERFLNPGAQVLNELNETEAKFKRATHLTGDHCLLPSSTAHSSGSSATAAAPRPAMTSFTPVPRATTNNKIAQSVTGSGGVVVPVAAALQSALQQQQQYMFPLNPLQQHQLQVFLQQQISQQQTQQHRLASAAIAKLVANPIPPTAPKFSPLVVQRAAAPAVPQTVPPQTTEPEPQDLLSGFDKVIKSPQATSTKQGEDVDIEEEDLPHSPPFTSRSFDDFHRFLGKDLTLLEEESEKQQQEPSAALFVEESYRMLTMDPQPNDLVAFRNLAMDTTATNNSEMEAISGVLDAVPSETNLFLHHPYGSEFASSAAMVSDATDTNSSEDSDESDGGPVRKKIKTDSSSSAYCY